MKKIKMENNKTENAQGEMTESQVQMQEKAVALMKFLDTEPRAALAPVLRVTEQGIVPDVKLAPIPDEVTDNATEDAETTEDTDTEDAEGGSDDAGDSTESTTDEESAESQS